jgi:integrase
MSASSLNIPSYRLYRRTGQAVVTLSGKDHYLGKYDSPESREKYARLIAEWILNGRRPTLPPVAEKPDFTIAELILRYLEHCDRYYQKDGRPTGEARNVEYALRPLRRLYGSSQVEDFGPLALKTTRAAMIETDICRNVVNKWTRHIVRMFKWGVENELVPPMVHHALKAVAGLKAGRSAARESEPVRPVDDDLVDAIEPFVARAVWTMVQLQRLTGMRSGEVTIMRTGDLDMSGRVWTYTPRVHKSQHVGKARTVHLGPRAQELLKPWLRADREAFLFSPAEAEAERKAEMRRIRQSKVQPSQVDRSKARPEKQPGDYYTTESFRRSIARACSLAGIPAWHPHQLRHSCATRLRKEFDIDTAAAVLGHSTLNTTEHYASRSEEVAAAAMTAVG